MRNLKISWLIAVILSLANSASYAQGAGVEWDTLNKEVMRLNRAGEYARAIRIAQSALEVAEQNVGPDHPDVATSLNNLAYVCIRQGEYAKAEPLYKRSLAILEKALGSDHPSEATSLKNLAELYRATNRPELARPLEARADKIRATKR
jgi:tetratricopeptide (TPR) repeat protein